MEMILFNFFSFFQKIFSFFLFFSIFFNFFSIFFNFLQFFTIFFNFFQFFFQFFSRYVPTKDLRNIFIAYYGDDHGISQNLIETCTLMLLAGRTAEQEIGAVLYPASARVAPLFLDEMQVLYALGVKVRNMKMDFNIYGNWCRVGQ